MPFRYEPTWEYSGKSVTYDAVYMPLRDQAGQITGVLGVARDITERRRLEAALRQAQKMEALGQLAGGVAHDFNNVLTGILGCFDLLGRQSGNSERAQRLITQGLRAADRGKALTSRLLAFSRQQPLATEPVDVNASIEELSEMLTRSLGADIRIGKRLAHDLWPAIADRNQLELAIMNLAINARDAMPLGGTLTIESRNEVVAALDVDDLEAGEYVSIAVTDSGSGMAPDVLARVLEPFFTTKEAGKGTGLGLSMVYGVVRQLGGGLRIASELGKGTRITLYLPRAQLDKTVERAPEPQSISEPATILLVDDDPNTQAMVAAFAAELGHTVIPVEGSTEALAIIDSDQVVDIVIADSSLPAMGGAELIAHCTARRRGLAALLLSAKPNKATGTGADGPLTTLAKPFGRDAFINAVETARGGSPSAKIIPMHRALR